MKMKRTGPTNPELQQLIRKLRMLGSEQNAPIWKRLASDLERPTRNRRIVNLGRIAKHVKENEHIVVPGKVLANGDIDKSITISAFRFSREAKEKLENAKAVCMTITEAMVKNPKGKNLKIIG